MANVTGPTSSTDTAIARWNGTTGAVIEDSTVTVDGSGNITTSGEMKAANVFSGGYVTALGENVGVHVSGSHYYTGIGFQAVNTLTTGDNNTAVGHRALYGVSTGNNNTGIGSLSLANLLTGSGNTALGSYGTPGSAGPKITGGSNNTTIGYLADADSASAANRTALGANAIATTDNAVQIGDSNVTSCRFGTYYTLSAATLSGTNTGDQTITLTGDVTGSGTGSFAATIKSNVALAGNPTTTTQSSGDNSTKIATTAYVDAAAGAAGGATIVGLSRNAKMSVTTASATATFTADEIIVETALGGTAKRLASYSQSINLGTTGAGGMDTGSAPTSGFVSLYAIAKTDGTQSILACNETTSNAEIYSGTHMPSGYTYSALIGVWPTNGSSQFKTGYILSRTYWHGASVNVLNNAGGASATAYTSITLTSAVPAKANGLFGTIGSIDNNYSTWQLSANSGGVIQRAYVFPEINSALTLDGFVNVGISFDFPLPTSQTMYYKAAAASSSTRMNINGYTF